MSDCSLRYANLSDKQQSRSQITDKACQNSIDKIIKVNHVSQESKAN
jgi:hypothetical protein